MESLQDINPVEKMLVDKANRSFVPINASFELTPVCNLHCEMCYIRMDRSQVEARGGLRTCDEWLHIAKGLQRMGTLFILLTGGEPLLYPHFRELYTRLKEMGFILTLNTNATLIDEETARWLQRLKPRRVNVSLYGATNETYDNLCHASNGFDRCMEGLRHLKKQGIDTKLNLTLTRQNVKEHSRMLAIADELGMPALTNSYLSVCLRPGCAATARCITAVRPAPQEAAQAEVKALKHKYGADYPAYAAQMSALLGREVADEPPHGVSLSCRAGKSSCWINWQGVMTPCVDMETPAVPLLSAPERPVDEAWRQIVAQCKTLPVYSGCRACSLRPVCDVCYANAANETAVTGTTDYLCRMAKAKRALLEADR